MNTMFSPACKLGTEGEAGLRQLTLPFDAMDQ